MGRARMISYQLYQAGYCQHCERITRQDGRLKKIRYPSLCALIRHPVHGNILYDTGYSERFSEATRRFPERLYQLITPVTQTESLKSQLCRQNISPESIQYIIISHFHSDHLGGLKDFPNAQFICHPDAWKSIQSLGRIRGLLKAFMPCLLPDNFKKRLILIDPNTKTALPKAMQPFKHGYDLFNNQNHHSLYAVSLPGHAAGHIGLYFQSNTSEATFFIGDSCWHHESYQ